MAWEGQRLSDSFVVDTGTTGKQYYIVKHTTSAQTVTTATTAGDLAFGVLQDGASSGATLEVAYFGVTKVAQDGTLAPGGQFMCSTAALAVALTTAAGVYRLGQVITAPSTVSGTIATVLWNPNGRVPA